MQGEFSHYDILEPIGAGGMGEVYRARDQRLGREVALKILPKDFATDPERRTRFLREARLAAGLSHPNIATIHEADEVDGHLFYAMELLKGDTLKQRIRPGGLSPAELLDIAIPLAEGLAAAHHAGIVHRDLKPDNVMMDQSGLLKILDFGLSRQVSVEADNVQSLTQSQQILGTPSYMSPEQVRGKTVDTRSDLFSLGAMLYELGSGVRPFFGTTHGEIMDAVLHQQPLPMVRANPRVDDSMASLIARLLEKDRTRRVQTADDLLAQLRSLRASVPARRPNFRRLAVVGLIVALAIAAGMQLFGDRNMVIRSIAVLPLENLSGDPEQEFFADGMTDALIADLAQIGSLRVISRTSVMQYKGGLRKPLPEIARELNVDAIVTGTVFREGDQVRITAQLIHARTDQHLWADRYDRKFVDILALHSEVARAIAWAVNARVTSAEEARLASSQPVDPEAYELYLRGRAFAQGRAVGDFEKSFDYLGRAIEKDPNYAPAYATLAMAYSEAFIVYLDLHKAYPEAKKAVTRALELDDGLAEAHAVLGRIRTTFEWDWDGAEQAYQRALEFDPSSAIAHREYGAYLILMGRFDAAFKELALALELDPISIRLNRFLGWGYFMARRYDEAIAQNKKTLELLEQFPDPTEIRWVHEVLVLSYTLNGMYEEALAEVEEWVPASSWRRAFLYAKSGRRDEAAAIIKDVLASSEVDPFVPVAAILGDKDFVFERLELWYEEHHSAMVNLKVSPLYDNLRSDPRFHDLMRRMKFLE